MVPVEESYKKIQTRTTIVARRGSGDDSEGGGSPPEDTLEFKVSESLNIRSEA